MCRPVGGTGSPVRAGTGLRTALGIVWQRGCLAACRSPGVIRSSPSATGESPSTAAVPGRRKRRPVASLSTSMPDAGQQLRLFSEVGRCRRHQRAPRWLSHQCSLLAARAAMHPAYPILRNSRTQEALLSWFPGFLIHLLPAAFCSQFALMSLWQAEDGGGGEFRAKEAKGAKVT